MGYVDANAPYTHKIHANAKEMLSHYKAFLLLMCCNMTAANVVENRWVRAAHVLLYLGMTKTRTSTLHNKSNSLITCFASRNMENRIKGKGIRRKIFLSSASADLVYVFHTYMAFPRP